MTTYLTMMLLMIAAAVTAIGLNKVGKAPKMPAFYQKMVREGIFNKFLFQNYHIRKVLEHGKELPEVEISNVCSLYNVKREDEDYVE